MCMGMDGCMQRETALERGLRDERRCTQPAAHRRHWHWRRRPSLVVRELVETRPRLGFYKQADDRSDTFVTA